MMKISSRAKPEGPSRFLVILLFCVFAPSLAQSAHTQPQRIVSTSPSITEDLFALGLGSRVVGVSNYCEYPQEVRDLPKVGTFLRPDPELIARLRPDLVIVHKLANELANRLTALHIPFAEVDRGTLQSSYTEIQQIGRATGAEERAAKLVANMETRLKRIRAQVAGRRPPTVVFVVGREPGTLSNLVVVGRDAFLNELIDVAGGKNVMASDSLPAYPHISLETILRLDPDVIIDMGDMGAKAEERKERALISQALWRQVPRLNAVRQGRVFCPTSTAFLVPGPRSPEAAEILLSILHGYDAR